MTTMRIGLISDVHADLEALGRAFDLLTAEEVDKVLCMGDLVEKGDDGDAVVAAIESNAIPCVQGNHDENAVKHARGTALFNREKQPLRDQTIAYLDQLPMTRRYRWMGIEVMMCHAIPSSNGASLFRTPEMQGLSKRIKKDLRYQPTDILLVGHTHIPMQARYLHMQIFNPGSVCRQKARDSHTCAILTLPECRFQVYDLATQSPCETALIMTPEPT